MFLFLFVHLFIFYLFWLTFKLLEVSVQKISLACFLMLADMTSYVFDVKAQTLNGGGPTKCWDIFNSLWILKIAQVVIHWDRFHVPVCFWWPCLWSNMSLLVGGVFHTSLFAFCETNLTQVQIMWLVGKILLNWRKDKTQEGNFMCLNFIYWCDKSHCLWSPCYHLVIKMFYIHWHHMLFSPYSSLITWRVMRCVAH